MDHAIAIVPAILRAHLRANALGVYVLGCYESGRLRVVYVGRSDSCLLTRLLGHEHREQATHVAWKETRNPRQAYHLECTYYHTHLDKRELLNERHPAAPKGSGLVCPVCSFADQELAEMA